MFFLHIKMLSFLFHTQKSTKSIKITKTQISEQAAFLTLDVFYAHKNATFFVFVRLYAFYAFFCVWNFLVKNQQRDLKLPWYPHLLYYWRAPPLNLPIENLFISTYFYLWQSFFSWSLVKIFFLSTLYNILLSHQNIN